MKLHHVLISGGNGLIGKHVTKTLIAQGHQVSHLSRSIAERPGVKTYQWDVEAGHIDRNCLDGVDTIIHLAGESMGEKRWTAERKEKIISSRTESIKLIYKLIAERPNNVTTIIAASGVAYYGDQGDEVLNEESNPGNDFLGSCCVKGEAAVEEGKDLGLRIVIFRTGVVLANDGGALASFAKPIKSGMGSVIGSGYQWVPWIHIQDVVGQYVMAVNYANITGVYNQTAPEPVTNRQLTESLATHFKKSLWLPALPAFLMKLIMGEMSVFVLNSTKAVPQHLLEEGYLFKYPELRVALNDLYTANK